MHENLSSAWVIRETSHKVHICGESDQKSARVIGGHIIEWLWKFFKNFQMSQSAKEM
jgi:hypothetical protein